jgi:hypothetical protein
MSDVISRTILIGKGSDGYHRVCDWCRVTTSVGYALEPFTLNRANGVNGGIGYDFNWKEAGNRIDGVDQYDPNCQIFDERTIGGPVGMPIEGY